MKNKKLLYWPHMIALPHNLTYALSKLKEIRAYFDNDITVI